MMRKQVADGSYTVKDSSTGEVEVIKTKSPPEILWTATTDEDQATPDTANLISSLVHRDELDSMHIPVIDLDIQHHYEPSSTKGHAHLYLNKELTHSEYGKLLTVLAELGIVQNGILEQFKRDGFTCARLPGMKKGSSSDDL